MGTLWAGFTLRASGAGFTLLSLRTLGTFGASGSGFTLLALGALGASFAFRALDVSHVVPGVCGFGPYIQVVRYQVGVAYIAGWVGVVQVLLCFIRAQDGDAGAICTSRACGACGACWTCGTRNALVAEVL